MRLSLVVLITLASGLSATCKSEHRGSGSSVTLAPRAHLAERRASHSTTALDDGELLVVGGFRKGADGYSQIYSGTTELVDPATGQVRAGPVLGHARGGHLAAGLRDGSILIAGGWSADGLLRSAERYDPVTSRFAAVGDLHDDRGGATATVLADGRVLIAGGGEDGATTATTELYDPAMRRFKPHTAMARARLGHSATLLADGTVLVVGGLTGAGAVLASAELYDPRTGTFTATGAMARPRYKHAAIVLGDGRVLVVGGSDARDWRGMEATTELYNPATRTFTAGPPLAHARFKLPRALVALPDGRIAIAGGAASVEVLDPHGASHDVARLARASYYGTATLAAGQVIIVGGYGDDVQATDAIWTLAAAEVVASAP